MREVFEETKVTAKFRRMVGIRCDRNTWYMLLEMEYIEGIPTSDMQENSEALFCEMSEALTRDDCTEMTKVALRKILDDSVNYFYSDLKYKEHKGDNYTLYI